MGKDPLALDERPEDKSPHFVDAHQADSRLSRIVGFGLRTRRMLIPVRVAVISLFRSDLRSGGKDFGTNPLSLSHA